MADFKYYIEG